MDYLPKRTAPLIVALAAVHPACGFLRIDGRSRDPVSVAKPLEEVAILAATTAEGRMLRMGRLPA